MYKALYMFVCFKITAEHRRTRRSRSSSFYLMDESAFLWQRMEIPTAAAITSNMKSRTSSTELAKSTAQMLRERI